MKNYLIIDNGISKMRRIIFVLFLTFSSLFAQDPNWNSFITFPQYPSPYFSDWERNPDFGTFNLNYLGTDPVEFYFEVIVNVDGYGEAIKGRTAMREFLSGPQMQVLTFNDISDWKSTTYNKDLERIVLQTGKLPESSYSICVTTYAKDGTLLTDACTDFDIALPNPPQLISPENEGSINITQPTFMWNIVSTPPELAVYYQLKIVEMLDGQTTFRALEANIPIVTAEVPTKNLYTYRLDDYPLKQNHSYAWQVQATNSEGVPISSNEGFSEIWQFTYGSPAGEVGIDTLMLIEDFAYLIDLDQLDVTDNNTFLNLDGSCRMLVKGIDGIDKFIDVFAQNLMLQKDEDSYDNPIFLGGSVLGSIYDEFISKDITGEFFKPTELEFIPPNQFTIGGNFYLGDDVDIPLTGKLSYVDGELIGELLLLGDPTTPVFAFGDDSFKMNITSLSLTYPDIETKLEGGLSLFGTPSNCSVDKINLDKDGSYNANISCDVAQEIAMLQGSSLFVMNVNSVEGNISGNLTSNKLDYSVMVDGGLNFNVNPDNAFGADVVFELQPNKFNLISFEPTADVDASSLDLGWVKWNLQNMKLNNLAYQNGIWNFNLVMDIDLSFPDFTDTKLPTIYGISFTPNGFEFPQVEFNNFSIPNIDFQAFELELYGISIPKFTFDLSSYTPGSIAQMAFDWNVKFNMPNLPNGTDEKFRFPNWDLKASIVNGNFNLDLPELNFPSGHKIALPGGTLFNVKSFSGKLNTSYNSSLMNFLPDVKIGGELTLPEALQCNGKAGNLKIESISLNGNGSISGVVEDVVPKCPINIGLASLYMKDSKIEFKNIEGQKIYLDGKAGIKFSTDPNQKEVGSLSVIYEVLNNKIIKAEGEIDETFTWDLVGDKPTFSFEVEEAKIKNGKLIIDGRSKLKLSKGEMLGVTFDQFTIDLNEYIVEDGRVIFDDTFAMVVDGIENDEINFKAVNKGDIPETENYLYYELPEKIILDKNGFAVQGKSKAMLKYQGKKLGDLSTEFSNDFAFSLKPFKVAKGRCDIFFKEERVAYFNSDGFFPDPNYFLNRVIPDKIPLPTLEMAYLQIKRDDNLLIDVRTEGNSTRFSTRVGEPVELVFPSMQFDLPEAPKILVNFDISIDDVTGEVTDGFIRGVIPEESIPSFDLSRVGIPYTIYSVYYGNIDGVNKFRLTGKAKLFDTEVACQDSMTLTLSQSGILEGRVSCDVERIIPLIPDSDKLNLHLNNVAGEFNADLFDVARNFNFNLQLDSDVRFNISENESWGIWTLLGLNKDGLQLIDSRIDDVAIPQIDLDQFKLRMENLNLGRLAYNSTPDADGNSGWDFEFGMDLDFEFPELGMEIPNIPNVILNRTGFHTMNRISVPSFPDSLAFEFQGIELKPLAFRAPKLDFNWFTSEGSSFGNGFLFRFGINFPNIEGGSGTMRNPELIMNDASFLDGILIGNIELAEFDLLDGLNLNFGGGLGFSVTEISGGFFDDNGSQGTNFNFKGHLKLPEFMRCDGEETTVDLSDVSFSLNSSGHVAGVVENFVPRCPIDLGFGHFVVTSSTINFSVADSGQVAILDMTGDLVVDTGDDNTVTANGVLQMNLLTGEIIDGSITIEDQFVWAIPKDKPVLRFTINRAVLDMDGLTIDGESNLLLPGGQTRNAHFRNFKFDYRKYKVKSGSLEIDADFAIKFAMEEGEVTWSVISADEPLTENQTAKIGFTSNLILDANGLSTNGEAVAAIRWDDDPAHQFGNLLVRYTNNFKFSLRPFMVSEGRADLIHVQGRDETIIATLTHDGLNLGDIFGIIPIPEIIPLPDRDIAYLRIKSGNRVLVQSEMVDGNFRIISTEERPAALVIPSLKQEGSPVDSIDAIFNIVISPTAQIVSGEITLVKGDSLSIINLRNRGIPADIFKLNIKRIDGVNTLTADAQVDLPGVMDGLPIKMRKLRFNRNGLSGNVDLGIYSEEYLIATDCPNDELPQLGNANLGTQAIITLEGVDVSFGDNNTVGFSGKFVPRMFGGDDAMDIQYAANWNNEEGKFTFTFDFKDGEVFDFGVGTFTPGGIAGNPAMQLSLTEEDFELLISGMFRSEQFGDDFNIAIEALKITKNSVSAEAISKPIAHPMSFKLFNSQFRIFDKDRNNKAIRFTYNDNVLKMILNGDITLFGRNENRVNFSNLTIGTDGSFSIDEANFLNRDLTIVDNYIVLNQLGISDSKLAIGGWVKIPEPVGTGNQFDFGFRIDPNGEIDGEFNPNINGIDRFEISGKNIKTVFIDEPQRIGNPASTEYDFWKAKFDVTYLALDLNFETIGNSSVQMVSDIYWDNEEDKRVSLGSKSNRNTIDPGLRITFTPERGKYVHWGTARVNGDLVNFDEDMYKIKVGTVELSSDRNNNLTFGITGEFGLNFDAIEGGLGLANFQFNKMGIVDIGQIASGSLSIDGVGAFSIHDVGFSSGRETIEVSGGEMPGVESGNTRDATQRIEVDNYLSFGGSITFGKKNDNDNDNSIIHGEVERFLSYSTTDEDGVSFNTLVVKNVNFATNGFNASMDLLYYSGGNDFLMRIGGSANFKGKRASMVGKIARVGGEMSLGLFLTFSTEIQVGPVTITEVGGGFFYRPTADDILTVKRIADVGDKASGKIAVQGGTFAVFLFGEAVILDRVLIKGRVLLTVTDNQFMLDGKVILLDMENKIEGEAHLLVKWSPEFSAEGEITIDITVPRIVNGTGKVGFYVYSRDQWAIYGETDMKLFNYLESNSEFFVSNSGFMLGMSSSVDFDIWIIEVGAGIEVKVWKMETWGAYAEAYVYAEMLWGIAKAKGWLKCALIGGAGHTILYGQAGLKIRTFLKDWDGSAWAKIDNGRLSGGSGSDSDMDALIAEAAGQSAQAEQEMADMKSDIENRVEAGVSFSREDLEAAFTSLTEWGSKYRYGTPAERSNAEDFFTELREIESLNYQILGQRIRYNPSRRERNLYKWIIEDIYQGKDAPDLSGYSTQRRTVLDAIQSYDDNKNRLIPTLDEAMEVINTIENEVEQTVEDPTINTVFPTYTGNAEGRKITSPSMNVNEDLVNQNKANMNNGINSIIEYRNQINAQYEKLNNNIEILESALRGRSGDSGAEGFSRSYITLMTEIQRTYLSEYLYYKRTHTWAASMYSELISQYGRVVNIMEDKASNLYNRGIVGYAILQEINVKRVEAIAKLRGDNEAAAIAEGNTERSAWNSNVSLSEEARREFALRQSVDIGKDLWYRISIEGLRTLRSNTRDIIRSKQLEKNENIEAMGELQAEFTTKMNRIYATLASMSETKYDILSKLIDWEEVPFHLEASNFGGGVVALGKRDHRTRINILRSEKTLLEEKMTVPIITQLKTRNFDDGMYSVNRISWNASGPRANKTTYMIDYSSSRPNISNQGYQSVGNSKTMYLYYSPLISQSTFGVTDFKLKARNEIGYTIHRNLSFTPTFSDINEEFYGYTVNETSYNEDVTPPTIGEYLSYAYIRQNVQGEDDVYKYYVSDKSNITASWSGSDNESGIQEYRYKLVKTQNPEAPQVGYTVSDKTRNVTHYDIGGNDDDEAVDIYENWVQNYGRNDVVINDLNMEDRDVYQLHVVAKNGDGLWTEEPAGTKQYIIADLTPPTAPRRLYQRRNPEIRVDDGMNGINPEVELPGMVYNLYNRQLFTLLDNSEASLTFRYGASTDEESGITGYEFFVSKVGDNSVITDRIYHGPVAGNYITLRNNSNILDGILNYVDSFYVDIRAINKARNRSEFLRYKMQPFDDTPPSKPEVNFAYSNNYQRAYIVFDTFSVDEESGIKYYEVGIGSSFYNNQITYDDSIRIYPQDIGLNKTALLPVLPERTRTFFTVRAVNGQGTRGQVCRTGPFYHDDTPPNTPIVAISKSVISGRAATLNLLFGNVQDNQSRIRRVEYQILKQAPNSNAWYYARNWTESPSNRSLNFLLREINVNLSHKVKVKVRAVNSVGLVSATGVQEYVLDTTPPITPDVSVSYSSVAPSSKGNENNYGYGSGNTNYNSRFTLNFENIEDDETGIEKIEYQLTKAVRTVISRMVRDFSGKYVQRNVVTYRYVSNSVWHNNNLDLSKRYSYSSLGYRSGDRIRIKVKTTNRRGVVSQIGTREVTLP